MERLLVLENIRRRRYLLLNMFRVKMDIIIIQQLIKILDNDVQGDPAVFGVFSIRPGRCPIQLLIFQSVCPVFPASAELLRRTPSGPLCWQCEAHTLSDVGCGRMQDTGCFFISRGVR